MGWGQGVGLSVGPSLLAFWEHQGNALGSLLYLEDKEQAQCTQGPSCVPTGGEEEAVPPGHSLMSDVLSLRVLLANYDWSSSWQDRM